MQQGQELAKLKDKFHIYWGKGTQTKEALSSWKAKLPERLMFQSKQNLAWSLEEGLSLKDVSASQMLLSFLLLGAKLTPYLLSWSLLPLGV